VRNFNLVGAVVVVCSLSGLLQSQAQPVAGPNSDPVYQQLRNISLGNEAVTGNSFI
jgi:hypothetical protein